MKYDSENAEHRAKLEEIRGRFPEKWLSGPEMLQILKTCGVAVRQFADHLGRSDNYVRQCLGYRRYTGIPLLIFDELRAFIGSENFRVAFAGAREETVMDMFEDEQRGNRRVAELRW